MRRWLLPALMITLLLTGCGGSQPARRLEKLRDTLSTAQTVTLTADIDARNEEEVFSCTVLCTAQSDSVSVELTAPETVAGIRAVTDAEGTRIEYDGVSLGVGSTLDGRLSPAGALPQLLAALRTGSVLRSWTEREGERQFLVAEFYVADDTTLAVWLDGETLTPLSAEFRRGDAVALRCEIRDFTYE